jgi:UDP-N-acetylglucosamine 2-epimerase (non-hydrolysing)
MIAVVSTSRADYYHLRPVMQEMTARSMSFGVVVSGSHHEGSGLGTRSDIEADGFPIVADVPLDHPGDDPVDIATRTAEAVRGFAAVWERLAPETIVLLGDRYEVAAAAFAALPFLIPIGHVAGGEVTRGAFDEALRHSITKLAHLHFVSHDAYAKRVAQLGEEPWRIIVTGLPGIDTLRQAHVSSREEFMRAQGWSDGDRFLLFTYHPETLSFHSTLDDARTTLDASLASGLCILATAANADTWGTRLNMMLRERAQGTGGRMVLRDSLGKEYASAMCHAEAMVGNSSSGIIEAPWFGLPVVNVGNRQAGRVRGCHVIDVPPTKSEVSVGLARAISSSFRAGLETQRHLFGDGRAAGRICDALQAHPHNETSMILKEFVDHDIDWRPA